MTPQQLFYQQRRVQQQMAGASLADWIARGLGAPNIGSAIAPQTPINAPSATSPLIYVGITLAVVAVGLAAYSAYRKDSQY